MYFKITRRFYTN